MPELDSRRDDLYPILVALAAGDYDSAMEILRPLAKRQRDHRAVRYRAAVTRIEDEFRGLFVRAAWDAKTSSRDRQIYRDRVAHYCSVLGTDHLIRDMRLVAADNKVPRSLKYFVVPSRDHVCRWESHAVEAFERKNISENDRFHQQLANAADTVFGSLLATPEPTAEWVEKARTDLEWLKNNPPDDVPQEAIASQALRIMRALAVQGYMPSFARRRDGWDVTVNYVRED